MSFQTAVDSIAQMEKYRPAVDGDEMVEDKMVVLVENCLFSVKHILIEFFNDQKRLLPQLAREVLVKGRSADDIMDLVFNEKDVYQLQSRINESLENNIINAGLLVSPGVTGEIDTHALKTQGACVNTYADEARTSLYMMTAANVVSDLVCESWASRGAALVPGFNLVGGILNIFSLQSIYERARDDFHHSAAEVEKRLNGLLETLHNSLENELTLRVATALYELEDNQLLGIPA